MSYKIAVGSSDGKNVDLKFGEVNTFSIYEVQELDFKFLENREVRTNEKSLAVHGPQNEGCESKDGCASSSGCGSFSSGCGGNGKGCNGASDVLEKISVIDDCRCVLLSMMPVKAGFLFSRLAERERFMV